MPKSLIKNEELTYLWRTKNTTQVSDVDLEKKYECQKQTWLQISFFCFSLFLTIFENILSSYDRFFMVTLALTVVFWPWRWRNCSKCEGYLPYLFISFTKENVNVDVRQRVFGEHHRQNHLGILFCWFGQFSLCIQEAWPPNSSFVDLLGDSAMQSRKAEAKVTYCYCLRFPSMWFSLCCFS